MINKKSQSSPCRCGAYSRRTGGPCNNYKVSGRARCRMHGGLSTGPRTAEGLERSKKANWKHGLRSAEFLSHQRMIKNMIHKFEALIDKIENQN